MNINNKHITIIGAERSGIAAAKLAKKVGAIPFVSDSGDNNKLASSIEILEKENINYETGIHSDKVFNTELFVVSPGVPLNSEIILNGKEKGIKIIGELEFAFRFSKGKIIAITGTNGKTTTTSLCGYMFSNAGYKTFVGGNIGKAYSEFVLDTDENSYTILEVSSFQLDTIENFKPDIAVLLNITPDHLNRYENNFELYINSKFKIFQNQNQDDFAVINGNDINIKNKKDLIKSNIISFSDNIAEKADIQFENDTIFMKKNNEIIFNCKRDDIFIPGSHNLQNAMSVIAAAKTFNIKNDVIINSLKTFKGVPHRLEIVRELNGVKYINDSKATNVDSVYYALKSYDSNIFLILGGEDKGNDYEKIKNLVIEKVKKIYAIGSSSKKIFNYFHSLVKVEVKETLLDCIKMANTETREGDIVLLSPACASFDMFKNYEHRGEVFKEGVMSL